MATTVDTPQTRGERWRSHRVASWLLRALIFLAPFGAAIVVSLWLSRRLFEPESAPQILLWWAILVAVSSVVAWAVDRLARKLVPLTVMLRATMLFPDRAPPRYKVALRTTNSAELRRHVVEAQKSGTSDLSKAAELILALASDLNDHDRLTRGHGERTRAYTDMLAEELKIPQEGRDKLRWAALLHDIGKLEVPSEILNKPGKLEPDELAIVRRHPVTGIRVAAPLVPWLGEWAGAIEHHHEWWDGSGYPRGLKGEEISLAARIVSVADAYDVMTSGRSYQTAKSPQEARREVAKMAGIQFDPMVVRALMNISLGRLRWVVGPVSWLGQIPFFLDRIGRDLLTLATAATVTAATVVSGVAPFPGLQRAADQIVAQVTETTRASDLPVGTTNPTGPGTTTPSGTTEPDATPETTEPSETTTSTGPGTSTSTTDTGRSPTATPPATSPPPTPNANPDVASTPEDTPVTVDVVANDTPGGLSLRSITSGPSNGTATIGSGRIRYSPGPGFSGTDTLGYEVCDSTGRCDRSTLAIRVNPVNDAPTANPDSATTDRNVAVTIGVLGNDTDPDGDSLSVGSVSNPPKGSAVVSGRGVRYTPDSGYAGSDTFSYAACDPSGACDSATVTVTVNATPRPPIANDDAATFNPGGTGRVNVLSNDSHPDGTAFQLPITVVSTTSVRRYDVSGGTIDFQVDRNAGSASIVYRLCDVNGLCDTATVYLEPR